MWFSGNYGVELKMTLDQARSASHSGSCDSDVRELSKIPAIARQLRRISADTLRRELKEHGAWDSEELDDHDQNLQRILWLASGSILDEYHEKRERPVIRPLNGRVASNHLAG